MKKTHKTTNGEQPMSGGVTSPKGIRLISLYIGSFEVFKGQIMNFCSDYCTGFQNAENGLHLEVKHKKVLPDDFFALNEGNEGNGCVKSVSAIIGKNGSGKTTLARLLCNLSASDCRKPEWKTVLIYEENGEVRYYPTFSPVTVELISSSGVRRTLAPDVNFLPYKLFYYSPHFTTEQFIVSPMGYYVSYGIRDEGNYVKSISTTWLLLYPDGNSGLLPRVGARQTSIFDADEKIRLFEFLAEYEAKRQMLAGKFDIPMPESISIGIHDEGVSFALQEFKDYRAKIKTVGETLQEQAGMELPQKILSNSVDEYLKKVEGALKKFWKNPAQHSFVANVFMSFVARYIQESVMSSSSFLEEKVEKGFLKTLLVFLDNEGWSDVHKIQACLEDSSSDSLQGQDEDEEGARKKNMRELIGIFEELDCLRKERAGSNLPIVALFGNVMYCRLGEQEVLDKICRLVRLHAETRVISPYLKFDVIPHMSSGEMSFLTMFARLRRFIGKEPKYENVVVFLDEAETTLHPEWQRRLVSYCIRFFEVFLPSKNYQLIFASHSPMLLTDVPKRNVVFVDEDYCVINDCKQKAFAANIFELYKDSFVLRKGQIGEFAASKVKELLGKLKSKRKGVITNEDLKLASLIDDPFISQHVWSRLGQLVMDNDMPEDEITEGKS